MIRIYLVSFKARAAQRACRGIITEFLPCARPSYGIADHHVLYRFGKHVFRGHICKRTQGDGSCRGLSPAIRRCRSVRRRVSIPIFLLLECVGNSMLLGPVPRKPFGLRGKRIPHLPRIVRSTGTGLNARLRYMMTLIFFAQTRKLSTTWFPTRSSHVFSDNMGSDADIRHLAESTREEVCVFMHSVTAQELRDPFFVSITLLNSEVTH